MERGEYNPCLDFARSPFNGSFLQNTHLFSNSFDEEDPEFDLEN
jgi:hypothetical protein